MADVETEVDTGRYNVDSSRFDDIDVESILARCERRRQATFSRKRSLYQGKSHYVFNVLCFSVRFQRYLFLFWLRPL